MEALRSLGPSRCIVAGVPADGTTAGEITFKNSPREGAITTGAADWVFPDGPGLLVCDYDPKTAEEGFPSRLFMNRGQWGAAVESVAPGLLRCCVYAPSSGSCLHQLGNAPPEPKGFHHYVVVDDARDIPRAGKVLFDRLILAGYGYGFATEGGRVEVRTIVDAAVWTPSRLFYTGGAACGKGVLQSREFATITQGAPYLTRETEVELC